MKKSGLLTLLSLILIQSYCLAQGLPEDNIRKLLRVDKIDSDPNNGDGTFRARNKKTRKWGLYQWYYNGDEYQILVPAEYDSLHFIPFNGNFSIVYRGDKAGVYLSYWSYSDEARESIACLYDDYQRYTANGVTYLAMKRDGYWGWVDWKNGKERSSFLYENKEDLPYPYWKQDY